MRRAFHQDHRLLKERPLSDEEVARFLKGLAAVYRDRRTGNSLLAEALVRVAEDLTERSRASTAIIENGRPEPARQENLEFLGTLDSDGVQRFLEDTAKTKSQLVELASARFSIPRSKLLRMKTDDVREAVRSALRHEASLAVITEEAARYGARRQS